MKVLAFVIVAGFFCVALAKQSEPLSDLSLFEQNDKAYNDYIDLLASHYVDEIIERNYKEAEGQTEGPVGRKLGQVNEKPGVNLKTVKMHPKKITPQERRLYESLTSSYLIGSNDDTSTTNHLSLLMAQQKSMQNMRTISAWLNDIENNLDEMRDAINRRVADLATGLQRRNMLLSHYNNLGAVSRG